MHAWNVILLTAVSRVAAAVKCFCRSSNLQLPDETRRSRLVRVAAIRCTRPLMRLTRILETVSASEIWTGAIPSERLAISHVLFLRF